MIYDIGNDANTNGISTWLDITSQRTTKGAEAKSTNNTCVTATERLHAPEPGTHLFGPARAPQAWTGGGPASCICVFVPVSLLFFSNTQTPKSPCKQGDARLPDGATGHDKQKIDGNSLRQWVHPVSGRLSLVPCHMLSVSRVKVRGFEFHATFSNKWNPGRAADILLTQCLGFGVWDLESGRLCPRS